MPNYFYNYLTVSHPDPKMMEKFEDAFESGHCMESFIPCPEDQKVDGVITCGWAYNNWGCKWDFGIVSSCEEDCGECEKCKDAETKGTNDSWDYTGDGKFDAVFTTPWNAPILFFYHLHKLGYTLVHRGEEETEECECDTCNEYQEHIEDCDGCDDCEDGWDGCDCDQCPKNRITDLDAEFAWLKKQENM